MLQSFETRADRAAGPPRLAALREAMRAAGAGGFLVPRADAHMGEYVAPHDQRLAWLTGFTGSAGICIALLERAALFVDGRYDLQAREQVDGDAFEIVRIETTRPEKWLAEAAPRGARIAYDPWLHPAEAIERFARAADKAGAEMAASDNLVDAIWHDQPPPPRGPVVPYPERLAGESSADKRARLGAALAEAGHDAAVVTLADSIAWLFNLRGSDVPCAPVIHAFAILRADGRAEMFVDPAKIDARARAHPGAGVSFAPPEAFEPALDALAGRTVAVDRAAAPIRVRDRLEAAGAKVAWARDPCVLPKARKNAAELAGTRAAHRRDGAAMVRFLHWLDETAPGGALTEIDVVTRLEEFRQATGELRDIAFETICGAGPHGAVIHYRVTTDSNRAVRPGELLLVDSGGQYLDGTTDITRTVAVGPPPPGAARAFTLVLKGMIAIARARWPEGLAGRDLDPLARAALWRAGYDYDHGTGHGVGVYLSVHEGPQSLSRRSDVALAPGMILSNEPGLYRAGEWGMRIENLLAVTPAATPEGGDRAMLGFETLTLCPIDRRLIEPGLMDRDEIAWLDAYHARVREEVGPLVAGEPDTAAWLAAATAPLGRAQRTAP